MAAAGFTDSAWEDLSWWDRLHPSREGAWMTNVLASNILDGKAAAAEIRAEVAAGSASRSRGAGRRSLRRAGRRGSRLPGLSGEQGQGLWRGRHAEPHAPALRRDLRGRAPRPVDELNADDEVDGILVQLPLPKQITSTGCSTASIPIRTSTISIRQRRPPLARPARVHPGDSHRHRRPAQAQRLPLAGRRAVVVGRAPSSATNGRPLLRENTTVTSATPVPPTSPRSPAKPTS